MRAWLLLTIFCIVPGLCWLYLTNTHTTQKTICEAVQTQTNKPPVSIKNVTLHEYSKKKDYELILKAEESSLDHTAEKVLCQRVDCTILKNNKDFGALHTTQSLIDRTDKTVSCEGFVHGRLQGVVFEGNDIVYNFADQVMTTQQPMFYTYKNLNLTAAQSTVNIAEQVVQMSGGVKTEFEN